MVRELTDDDIGLKVLYEPRSDTQDAGPASSLVDFVAIHGIGAHPDDTWCKKLDGEGTGERYINWLSDPDMLPAVVPRARIMRYGYESQWFGDDAIRQRVSTVAKRLLLSLQRRRKENLCRPLIFIAHCFGGLVILKAIVLANQSAEYLDIYRSTAGMLFFGTPFRGAGGLSQAGILRAIQSQYKEEQIQGSNLHILAPGNETLLDLMDEFSETRNKRNVPRVACFFEQKPSNVGAIYKGPWLQQFVVDETSGCLDQSESTKKYSLSRDHFNMNKFGKRGEEDFETICEVIEKMVEQAPTLTSSNEDEEKRAFRDSLSFLSMDSRYHAIDPPLAATCQWIFHQPGFQAWRDPKPDERLDERLLWLKANAGAGKSTLMKAIYEKSREQASSYTLYYFFNARSPEQELDNSFCGMLRSLLWRLLVYDLSLLSATPGLGQLKQQNPRVAKILHLNEMKALFTRCLEKVQNKSTYIYIDALDECPEDQARAAIRFFEKIAERIGAVRLLVSSRHCPFISHKGREIDMEKLNDPDIWKYIETYLPPMVDGESSQSLRTLIWKRSSGIFLWTVLAVNEVIKANDKSLAYRAIKDLVEKIPQGLELMIEDMLRRIDPVHQSKACFIFNWVLLASDALDPWEVFAMTRFDPQNPAANDARHWPPCASVERVIRTFSGGLLEVQTNLWPEESRVLPVRGQRPHHQYVQFIHESIRDYFQTSKSLKRLLSESLTLELIPNHTSLAEFCVDYIKQVPGFVDKNLNENETARLLGAHADIFRVVAHYAQPFGSRGDEVRDVAEDHGAPTTDHSNTDSISDRYNQLSVYLAGEAWLSDLDMALNDLPEGYMTRVLEFRTRDKNLRKILKFLAPFQPGRINFPRGRQGLFLENWPAGVMQSMYERLKTPFPLLRRAIDEFLHYLDFAQDDKVLQKLLDILIPENSFLKSNLLRSIICLGNLHLLNIELYLGAKSFKYRKYDYASSERLWPGWANQAVVRMAAGYGIRSLLEKFLALSPRHINFTDSQGWTPLDHALESGCASTSALLLQEGAKVNPKRAPGYVAAVIMKHGTNFAESLISNLAESKNKGVLLGDILLSAVHASEPDLISSLKKGGADLEARFDNGRDALTLNSWLDNADSDKVVKTLLRLGVSPNCVDDFGRTPLHYLSRRRDCCKAVESLLSNELDVNTADRIERKRLDINVEDRSGQTPLDFARVYGNHDVAGLLQAYGARSGSCADLVSAHEDLRSMTTKSDDEWIFDSDQGSESWASDSAG